MLEVMISRWLPDHLLNRIAAVGPQVDIVYDAELAIPAAGRVGLMYSEADRVLSQSITATRPFSAGDEAAWLKLMSPARVMFDTDPAYLDAIPAAAPNLRWIQGIASGAGELLNSVPLRNSVIDIATARGIHDDALADFAMMGILAHTKNLSLLKDQQRRGLWREVPASPVSGKKLCIVGLGSIGIQIARRAKAFDMRVTGVRRNPQPSPYADLVVPTARLTEALADADYVAITLPSTDETHHLFDRSRLSAMKPGVYIVNVGRGSVIDETALISALQSGAVAGAALDVFEDEPLSPESGLWGLDNVVLSPHCTSLMPEVTIGRLVDLFCTNLRRYLDGDQPLNCVDRASTY